MRFPANPCRRPRRHFNRNELGPNRGTSLSSRARRAATAAAGGEWITPSPRSHFPNPIGPYRPHSVAAPNLSNTPRIEQLMQNGKLYALHE